MYVFIKLILISTLTLSPTIVWAYVGPGSGLSAIGALLAVLGTLLFAIVGFIWYPVKRLVKFFKQKSSDKLDGE